VGAQRGNSKRGNGYRNSAHTLTTLLVPHNRGWPTPFCSGCS